MVCFSKTFLLELLIIYRGPNPMCITTHGLGSSYFARHYSRNRFLFLFLWVLRCFSSPRSLLIYYFTHIWILRLFALSEFPHSDISGLMDICSYPKLFAAYHVLLRLLVPSYSPYALCSLTLFSLLIINSLTLSQLLIGLIVFSSFWQLFEYLVYLFFSSIYFSMCFLQNIFLRITSSYFHKFFSAYKRIVSNNLFNIPCTTRILFRTFQTPSYYSYAWCLCGGLKWNRTIDLTLIRRAL